MASCSATDSYKVCFHPPSSLSPLQLSQVPDSNLSVTYQKAFRTNFRFQTRERLLSPASKYTTYHQFELKGAMRQNAIQQQTTACESDPTRTVARVLNTDPSVRTQAERLASMYLTHRVKELEARVEEGISLQPPVKPTFECVVDETAIASNIGDIKKWVGKGTVKMVVPISGEYWIH